MAAAEAAEVAAMVMVFFTRRFLLWGCGGGGLWLWVVGCGLAHSSVGIYIIHYLSKSIVPKI
jgi:hypothetical protein